MEITHGASFRKYLWERFHSKLPLPLVAFHYINAEKDPQGETKRLGDLIKQKSVDVAFIGIGENGHLAFNDPPADFETEQPYLVVNLDEGCRKQQLGEGWFPTLADVPKQAISMSVKQILKSAAIVCTVPDSRKATAVKGAVEGPVTPDVPASILQKHPGACCFWMRQRGGVEEVNLRTVQLHRAVETIFLFRTFSDIFGHAHSLLRWAAEMIISEGHLGCSSLRWMFDVEMSTVASRRCSRRRRSKAPIALE